MTDFAPCLMRSWAEIDLDAVRRNFFEIKKRLKPGVKLCCVVKADAYGHGAVPLARYYESLGADFFAVSNISEAIELRTARIKAPILILGYTNPECASLLAEQDISQCVYSHGYGKLLAESAERSGVKIKIHIKIDSGMGRIGFTEAFESLRLAYEICTEKAFITEGIFTHFAVADGAEEGREYTRAQYEAFLRSVEYLEGRGVKFSVRHAANSAGIVDYPDYALDMARAGIILYGMNPSEALCGKIDLTPAMTLKTVISHVKTVQSGDSISYGRAFIAERDMRIATVPIGYADGFYRMNYAVGTRLTVAGRQVPIVGRICMDQLMIDVSDIPEAAIGDTVTVFGTAPAVTAEEVAGACGTICYEVICSVSRRVPRCYIKDGKTVEIHDYIIGEEV